MGDAADDMYDAEMQWHDFGVQCPVHKCWYIALYSACPMCEDGELEDNDE